MESGIDVKQLDRFFKLIASVVTLVTTGKRKVAKVCEALQRIVNEPDKPYEFYAVPAHEKGGAMDGFEFLEHLKNTGRYHRTFSTEDELIQRWLADPSSYPDDFDDQGIELWRSTRNWGPDGEVAVFYWNGGAPSIAWKWLRYRVRSGRRVLLASS